MVSSMTGFGSREMELTLPGIGQTLHLSVEIKTLNARFFEVTAKLPACLSSLEGRISTLLKTRLVRGRVFLTIRALGDVSPFEKLVFSSHIAGAFIDAARTVKKEFSIPGELTIADVMAFPHVITLDKTSMDEEGENKVMQAIESVISEVVASRLEEGKFLEKDLLDRFAVAAECIAKISARNQEMLSELKAKASELMQRAQEPEGELQTRLDEVNHQLDKIAVHEEISRFTSHLGAAQAVIRSDDAQKGKKLDFILQELGRETNTLAAKCSDYQIAALSVDIKVELEKVREQAQNIV